MMKLYKAENYQLNCQILYNDYRNRILSVLPYARVEHIGSSSIPECISKGDLDIFVGVDFAELETSVQYLCKLGLHEKQNTLRTDSLCMLVCDDESQDVAIQVVANGSDFECFLVFRNKLMENPDLVKKYNAVKIASLHLQEDDYRAKKSEFINWVLTYE